MRPPSTSAPTRAASAGLMPNPDTQLLVLTVWRSRSGEFSVRAMLADGTLRDFASPFELARFVAALARSWPAPDAPDAPAVAPGSGVQTRGLR